MKLSPKQTKDFVDALNHRMTRIEGDVKWMKWIGYYMATLLTGIVIKFIGLI